MLSTSTIKLRFIEYNQVNKLNYDRISQNLIKLFNSICTS